MAIESRIVSRLQLVDVQDLPQVITEVFYNVIDRLEGGSLVDLNRVAHEQLVGSEAPQHRFHFIQSRAGELSEEEIDA